MDGHFSTVTTDQDPNKSDDGDIRGVSAGGEESGGSWRSNLGKKKVRRNLVIDLTDLADREDKKEKNVTRSRIITR